MKAQSEAVEQRLGALGRRPISKLGCAASSLYSPCIFPRIFPHS